MYYKVGQVLLLSGAVFLYYKAGQNVLQNRLVNTKWVISIANWDRYYKPEYASKKRQLLQGSTV